MSQYTDDEKKAKKAKEAKEDWIFPLAFGSCGVVMWAALIVLALRLLGVF